MLESIVILIWSSSLLFISGFISSILMSLEDEFLVVVDLFALDSDSSE